MKKLPTLFEREFINNRIVNIKPNVTKGCEWVLNGEGVATIKWDGACCAIINGELYKRFDAKPGRKIPNGAIPCSDPDPVTGHFPHWVKCERGKPEDKWFWEAFDNTPQYEICPSTKNAITYEAIGKHFNGNPYGLDNDFLIMHGTDTLVVDRTFDGISSFLRYAPIEGIVFWKDDEP